MPFPWCRCTPRASTSEYRYALGGYGWQDDSAVISQAVGTIRTAKAARSSVARLDVGFAYRPWVRSSFAPAAMVLCSATAREIVAAEATRRAASRRIAYASCFAPPAVRLCKPLNVTPISARMGYDRGVRTVHKLSSFYFLTACSRNAASIFASTALTIAPVRIDSGSQHAQNDASVIDAAVAQYRLRRGLPAHAARLSRRVTSVCLPGENR